jgi:hypothetical protein
LGNKFFTGLFGKNKFSKNKISALKIEILDFLLYNNTEVRKKGDEL